MSLLAPLVVSLTPLSHSTLDQLLGRREPPLSIHSGHSKPLSPLASLYPCREPSGASNVADTAAASSTVVHLAAASSSTMDPAPTQVDLAAVGSNIADMAVASSPPCYIRWWRASTADPIPTRVDLVEFTIVRPMLASSKMASTAVAGPDLG